MNAPGLTPNPSPVYVSGWIAASGWIAVVVALIVLVALFAVYYQTIGYYIQIGWDKLMLSRNNQEKVQVDIPNGPSMLLSPIDRPSKMPLDSDVEKALNQDQVQVFNVNRNIYRFSEAEPLCRAFGAELATYDQVKDAYKSGADWCNYGWIKGQLAVYPTQKETYDKLQKGPEKDRMSCGLPGVNGGHFPNEDQRFGVTCYGPRPVETALDERLQKPENSDIAFDREVNRFKAQRDTIAVTPWSSTQWSA
jgi:hypothetical protein